MELSSLLALLHGWFFLLLVFALGLGYTMFKGRQALINIILGTYLALFLLLQFPWLKTLQAMTASSKGESFVTMGVFAVLVVFSTWLFGRLMPREYDEKPLETLHKKLLLAAIFTALVLVLDNHFLPFSDFINTGTPLPDNIQSNQYLFWWLMLPLVVLFLL